MRGVLGSKDCVWRLQEVGHRASLSHELRIVGNGKIGSSTPTARLLKNRPNHQLSGPRQHRAAQNEDMWGFFLLQRGANFPRNLLDMAQVELAIAQAGSADTHKRNV